MIMIMISMLVFGIRFLCLYVCGGCEGIPGRRGSPREIPCKRKFPKTRFTDDAAKENPSYGEIP